MSDRDKTPRRHWSTKARLILAAVAVAGVGAAITTAAWSDDVFFEAEAEAGALNLVGRADPGDDWEEGDTEGTAIEVPVDALANLAPLDSRTFDVYVANAGTVTAYLQDPPIVDPSSTGAIFGPTATCPATVDFVIDETELAPDPDPTPAPDPDEGGSATITVTVDTEDWPDTCEGVTSTLVIRVTGSTTAP